MSPYGPESLIGQTIERYRLDTLLGMGGSGAVFLGISEDGRQAAIKILFPPMFITVEQRKEFRKRFLREAETLYRLHHHHILPILSNGEDEHIGCVYMVMPFMRGGTLADRIQPEGLPLSFVLSCIEQIADALDYAHERKVIHRDLKPTNILLDETDTHYLSDFGIAKLFEYNRTALTQTNKILTFIAPRSPIV